MTGLTLIPFWNNSACRFMNYSEQRLILGSLIGFRDLDLEFRVP
jgi:hypothetical protein